MLFSLFAHLPYILPPDDVVVIDVDINRPENNREVKVIKFMNVVKDGVMHNGFEIILDGDMQDFLADKYHGKLISDHEVLLTIPSMNHAYLHDLESFYNKQKFYETFCPRSQESHDIARYAICADSNRQSKKLLLRFPDDLVLSAAHYHAKDAPEGELNCDMIDHDAGFTWNGRVFVNMLYTVQWKVSILEDAKRILAQARISTKTKGALKLEERLMKSMNLNDDTDV